VKHKINSFFFLLIFIFEFYFLNDSEYFYSVLICTFLVLILIIGCGVVFLKLRYFVPSINKLASDKVLLTFDDGPDSVITEKILEILEKNNIGALFFLIGEKVEQNRAIADKIVKCGHLIGNHSYSHNNFMAFSSTKEIVKECRKADIALNKVCKDRPSLFRPPIGYTTPNYTRAIERLKTRCIGWRLRSYDTIYKTSEKMVKRLVLKTRKGDIVLFHDTLKVTSDSLQTYITEVQNNGIIFVSKEEIKTLFDE